MTRKDVQRDAVVSEKCFRLLYLKQEIQTDVKVLKPVLDEVNVLRLCHSLGMTLSSEGDPASMHKFEFGNFNSDDYDTDFARFIRENVLTGDSCKEQEKEQEDKDLLEINCLFGKQLEVKNELARMGFWDSGCEEGLSLKDQGVFCIEGSADCRHCVVFAWLGPSLFEPHAFRDTPAHVLRFLLTLSPNITCCVSQEDLRRIKSEVDAMSASSSMRWNSCSVAFRVQKQVKQNDSITCGAVTKMSIPMFSRSQSVWFVDGVVPSVAVENWTPSATEWITQYDVVPCGSFAQWLWEKHEEHFIELKPIRLHSTNAYDNVLKRFGQFPDEEISALQDKYRDERATAEQTLFVEAFECASKIFDAVGRDADLLFAVRCPANTLEMDSVQREYASFLQRCEKFGKCEKYQVYKMLNLPERIQINMELLHNVYQRHRPAFEEALNVVVAGDHIDAGDTNNNWFMGIMRDVAHEVIRWFWQSYSHFSHSFRLTMEQHQPRWLEIWMGAVHEIVSEIQHADFQQRVQQFAKDREIAFGVDENEIKQCAFGRLREYLKTRNGRSGIEIRKLMRTSDGTAVNITWSKEVAKEPMKVICMYQVGNCGPARMSLLGTMEFEPGFVVRKFATVKIEMAIAILVKENKTLVRRNQFSQLNLSAEPQHVDVRTFPRACSLCSIRASDRRVAFLFGVGEGSLGSIAFCRFNESFTSVEATQTIDIGVSFGLAGPLVDILLTERSLCVVDENGDIQSFDVRTRRTSKKASCGNNNVNDDGNWVGGLLSFADELVVGRANLGGNKQLCICSVSNEDHRALPSAVLGMDMPSTELAVGSMGDVLYVVNTSDGTIYSSQLSVTVRSDAYRIQRSGNGMKSSRQGCLQANPKETATQHWLRLFYHVFEKFPVRSLIDMSMTPDKLFSLELEIAVNGHSEENHFATSVARAVCVEYLNRVMVDLRRLNKPLCGLDLVRNLKYRCPELTGNHTSLQFISMQRFVLAIVSFFPVQICRAEDNMLRLLRNGQNIVKSAKGFSQTSSDDKGDASGTDAAKIAQTIRFGLLSPLLESWNGRCVVVTSMGKQSTGKSYFLNHLAGTSFAISGSRCTDGAWMSLRFVSAELLLVIIDFEGLGSFERSEQEDVFLSVLNASVSLFTIFRMESRFDKDIDSLFSRFQKGVQLIKNDPRLFRGLLYMSVKDVNMNDRQGVVDELVAKLDTIFEANKDRNFLTEMYAGQLEINCSPPFGTMDYYQCMENEAAQALCSIVFPSEGVRTGFVTGKAFLDCVRIVLAKISILDWTGMVKSTQNLIVADAKQKLPGILRTGCHVSLPLVADKIIPSHLKEDVLRVGSFEKIVVSLQVMCETNPAYKIQWMALNDVVPLDSIRDEEFDMGFDVTSLTGRNLEMVQKAIGLLFQFFLNLRGKAYGTSKLSTEDQSGFDAFEAFVLRRRKKKVSLWLNDSLGDHLSAVRSQLEQRYAEPLIVYMSRCQQRCKWCQLGCMYSVTHSPETEHNCCMDHKCRGQCEYGECQTDSETARVPACSRSTGHKGKCECEKGEHTCGQPCVLVRASNCDKTCSKRAEHFGDHSCSVQVHICGATCSATTCTATCLLDVQRDHSVHKCAEVQCFHPCLMEGCNNLCSEKNHFHGQQTESRAFAKENGMAGVGNDLADNAVVTHMCSCSHACGEMCTVEGICEQKVRLKKSARTYTGARGSFEYIYQEMNGCKKRCAHVKPNGEVNHEGLDHTCLAESNEEKNEQHSVHYCDARCPSCNYYCNKHFGHMKLHATSHGNMRQTYFMAKSNDIDVEDRKYQVGERGIAEMCNLFCAKVGRGHAHYLSCESVEDEKCVYTSGASKDHRRHCVDELFPPPGRKMDELLHAQFWTAIGWEDPCSEEERAVFTKCAFQCNAPEHEADNKLSYCVLDAWHVPEFKADGAGDGFAYVDGHKFGCVHAVDTSKFHSIFVLDSSMSMCGKPWRDLLCACKEFGKNRFSDGGEDDLVSYITFDSASRIVCEGKLLPVALKMLVPFTGEGGTSYLEGLRAANEVLSRNNFEEFKSVLIFFSDGFPHDIDSGITLAQHIRSTYAKYDLKAFVVGFGRVDLSVLRRLAAEMGGEYRQALNASALRTEFQRIAAVLCNSEASLALLESNTDSA